jgi:hypothetical protein
MTQELPFHDKTAGCFSGGLAGSPARFANALEVLHPGDPKAQLQAWIDQTAERIGAGRHTRDHEHTRMDDDEMVGLCRRARLSEPDIAAELLILISEGAESALQYEAAEGLGDRFRRAAEATVTRLSRR